MKAVIEFINSLKFEEPRIFRNLAISPLTGEGREKDFLLLREALREGLVIKEQPSQRVPVLDVENKTGSRILLIRGLYMRGGGQNRQVASNALLEKGYSGEIPTQCIEKQRWDHAGRRDFDYGGITTVTARITDTGMPDAARQQRVWHTVDDTITSTGSITRSRDLGEVYEQQGDRLEEYLRNFSPADEQLGFVAAIGINGKRKFIADIFDSHEAMGEMFEDLLRSYALEALTKKSDKVEMTVQDINLFLHAFHGQYAEDSGVSLGTDYTITGERGEGTALIEGDRVRYATVSREM